MPLEWGIDKPDVRAGTTWIYRITVKAYFQGSRKEQEEMDKRHMLFSFINQQDKEQLEENLELAFPLDIAEIKQ
ncbi:hypothetical protein D5R40_32870 [Okeania hirsuta]|uniref:Uncharacterized protein n=2 Tax=Okeania hirsuta TaxID=1458930 RepID=A0A3N6P6L3_9CYAN|nr:hypothetical protein D5R40_32870 [Okeania hirsuta]